MKLKEMTSKEEMKANPKKRMALSKRKERVVMRMVRKGRRMKVSIDWRLGQKSSSDKVLRNKHMMK
ncbi:hypothetical protein INR49_025617 [Caranx melampygus]|nr:hypothetical protein INR49_025617 [Caranx melampygus]